MKNGIRQGSCSSPYLFALYVDELNNQLTNFHIGCHVSEICTNNYSFADDLVILGPDAKSVNALLRICEIFAQKYYIEFNAEKTEAMVILPRDFKCEILPNIYLSGAVMKYVYSFQYFGHVISKDFTDDEDIARETRKLYLRGNTIVRKSVFLEVHIKCALFKSYCYNLYTCSLWSSFRQASMNKFRVAYNNIMRRLMNKPPWFSASILFVSNNVRSFPENIRYASYSLRERIVNCSK